jgi:hypothetical protein
MGSNADFVGNSLDCGIYPGMVVDLSEEVPAIPTDDHEYVLGTSGYLFYRINLGTFTFRAFVFSHYFSSGLSIGGIRKEI